MISLISLTLPLIAGKIKETYKEDTLSCVDDYEPEDYEMLRMILMMTEVTSIILLKR